MIVNYLRVLLESKITPYQELLKINPDDKDYLMRMVQVELLVKLMQREMRQQGNLANRQLPTVDARKSLGNLLIDLGVTILNNPDVK